MVFSHHLQSALAWDGGDAGHDYGLLGHTRGHHRASCFATAEGEKQNSEGSSYSSWWYGSDKKDAAALKEATNEKGVEDKHADEMDDLHDDKKDVAEKIEGGSGGADNMHEFKMGQTETFKAHTPEVQARVMKLQENITEMQSKWHAGLGRYDAAYGNVHERHVERMKDWEVLRTRLERKCDSLRDAVDRLTEAKEMCSRMQGEELPALFKSKAKDPDRFARFGDIQGCVRQDLDTGQFVPEKCECVAGTEKAGCTDAVGLIGNTLSCSHILNKKLPEMPVADFFKDGGACRINSSEPWNDAIVNKSEFTDYLLQNREVVNKASIGMLASSAMSVLPQCISTLSTPMTGNSRRKLASNEELRAFL